MIHPFALVVSEAGTHYATNAAAVRKSIATELALNPDAVIEVYHATRSPSDEPTNADRVRARAALADRKAREEAKRAGYERDRDVARLAAIEAEAVLLRLRVGGAS